MAGPTKHSMTERHRSLVDASGANVAAGKVATADGSGGVTWGAGGEVYYVPSAFTGVAVQTANDAAHAAGGGVVYCPAGTYTVGTAIALSVDVALLGAGREATIFKATANSINIVSVTGLAIDSTYEVAHAPRIADIEFNANGHTGVEGVALIGVAYWTVERCTFRGLAVGLDAYGSLQGLVHDTKFLSNTRGIKYSAQAIGYYGGTLPPSRVKVNWSTFYLNTTYAIDWSGGQQIIVENSEFGANGTVANAATGAITATMGGDAGGPGFIGSNLWLESNHGGAVIALSGTVVGQHSLSDLWLAYTDATYSISLDGSSAAQTLTLDRVHHDQVVSPATIKLLRSVGGTTYLDAQESDGTISGTWTAVRQEPLLSGQLVSDFSQWLALRLPNLTTTQRNAIASPTAGMVIWNTTTTAVNQYTGAAWAAVGGVSTLDDLTDVTITSPVTADRLRYDGAVWVNSALIWRPVTVYDPTSGLWVPLVDGNGNAIMAEA